MPAGDADQVFARPVLGKLAGDDLGQFDGEMRLQQGAIRLGQVGHGRKVAHAPVIDPLPDLAQAHLGLLFRRARRDQRRAQLVARQADQVRLAALGPLARQGQHVGADRGGPKGLHGADPFTGPCHRRSDQWRI